MAKNKRTLRDGLSNPFDLAFETDPAGDIRPAHLVLGAEKLTPASEANPLPVAAGGVEERLDAIEARLAGTLATQLSGSSVDLRGLIANRPAASAVEVGTTYWAVDRLGEADEVSVSDGSTWRNV